MSQQIQKVKTLCVAIALAVFAASCNSKSIPGIQNFNAAVQTEGSDQHFYAAFVATALNWNVGVVAPIPGLKGATIGLTPNLPSGGKSQGTVFQIDIDLDTLGVADYSLAGLPDNRALPGIDGGVLPRWRFQIGQEPIYVYLSSSIWGMYIPLDLVASDGTVLPDTISMEIDDSKGNLVGEVYAIPTQGGGTSSGILFLIPFTANQPPAQTSQSLN